jgi:hypothetical protein
MKRSFDTAAVLSAWPTLEPDDGFADRVFAACDVPAAPVSRRWVWCAAALVAAGLLAPLIAPRSSSTPSVSVARSDLDLGQQTD